MKKSLLTATWPVLFVLWAACTSSTERPDGEPGTLAPAGSEATAGSGAPIPGLEQDPELDAEARQIATLREQKIALLVEQRLAAARQAYADARFLEAENELLAALELDPGNSEVRILFDEVELALNKTTVPLGGSTEDGRIRLQARIERLKAETIAHSERGFRLLEEGEHDAAIGSLELAQANIRGGTYNIDWAGLDDRVAAALSRAQEEREIAIAARRDDEHRLVFERLQAEEAAARKAERARINTMFADAVRAFEEQEFDKSLRISEEILRLDPLNERTRELRDTTQRARHEYVNEQFLDQRGERFRRWVEENEEAMIPTTEILQYPDPEFWSEITNLRAHYREFGVSAEESEENLRLQREISSTRVPGLQVDGETSLDAVIDNLRRYTDIPFVVTPDAVDAVDAEGIEFNLNLGHSLTVENALKVITQAAGADVTYTFRNSVVYITTVSKAQGQLVLKAHDVQDLTAAPVDFAGPKIQDIRLPDQDYFDDVDEPIFGGPTGEPVPIMDPGNLENLVTQSIAPSSWEDVEGVSISYSNGFLIVWHTPEVQRQINAFLEDLRRYISSMVTIEARFLTIQKDFLQEIGVDFRGLGGTFSPPTTMANLDDITSGLEDNASRALDNDGAGLPSGAETSPSAGAFFDEGGDGDIRGRTENMLGDYGERLSPLGGATFQFVFLDDTQLSLILRAVEKNSRVQELNASTVSAQNTQRAFITVLNQITYIQDFDVEVAQAALIADPNVGVVNDGIVLDVRPTISNNRRYITLEMQPTVATLLRPIPEFTSSLAGLTTPVTLQLPELAVSSARTTAVVPDGGTVVIAGLKKVLSIDQRAEVPFLAKIPLLSVLFKAEGEAHEQQDVIVLIRAHITDAAEVLSRLQSAAAR